MVAVVLAVVMVVVVVAAVVAAAAADGKVYAIPTVVAAQDVIW